MPGFLEPDSGTVSWDSGQVPNLLHWNELIVSECVVTRPKPLHPQNDLCDFRRARCELRLDALKRTSKELPATASAEA
jgi:hypothetical protein